MLNSKKKTFKAKTDKIEIDITVTFAGHLVCVRHYVSLPLQQLLYPYSDVSNQKSYIACWLNKVTLASDTFLRYSPVLENIAF